MHVISQPTYEICAGGYVLIVLFFMLLPCPSEFAADTESTNSTPEFVVAGVVAVSWRILYWI